MLVVIASALMLPGAISAQASPEAKLAALREEMNKILDIAYDPKTTSDDSRPERINQGMIQLASKVGKVESEATDLATKAKAGVLRFEVASYAAPLPGMMLAVAKDVATRYRDSQELCKPIETYLFSRGLSSAEYTQIDLILSQSKNPEVVASVALARAVYRSVVHGSPLDEPAKKELAKIATTAPTTIAGKRAAFIIKLRSKLKIGETLPDLAFETATGKKIKLSDQKGKVVVLWFWGFWSGMAENEAKILESLSLLYYDKLVVVGINTDQMSRGRLDRQIKEINLSFPNVYTGSPFAVLPIDFGVTDYPATYVIDKTGVIRATPADKNVDKLIRQLLQ